ncbi:MAG: hypothetical protein ACKO34_06610 [Vampirovibrionales bacterium]
MNRTCVRGLGCWTFIARAEALPAWHPPAKIEITKGTRTGGLKPVPYKELTLSLWGMATLRSQ